MATTPTPADKAAQEQAEAQAQAKALADAEAQAKALADANARIAEQEAEIAALREQSAAQAAKIADPELPDGYVWVVDGDGKPIQGIPYAPKSWLTEQAGQLLPQGATKATKDGEAVVKAALAASRPRA